MIAIIGAGGHAKCVYECFYLQDQRVFGFFDDDSSKNGLSIIDGVRVLGAPENITGYKEIKALFIAIGDNRIRLDKYKYYIGQNYSFPNAIHERAYVSSFAAVGEGNFIMGPAVINPGSTVGNYCIVNTSATVGHDCMLEDAVQIGPGVNLAGGTTLKKGVFIGIGARVGPGVTIGPWSVVCAGSVVLNDLPENTFCSGIPARVVRHLE